MASNESTVKSRSLESIQRLEKAKRIIDGALQAHSEDLNLLKAGKQVSHEQVIKLAMQIRYNLYAPKEYKIGYPLVNGHPPAPQPEQMRIGCLAACNAKFGKPQESKKEQNERKGEVFVMLLMNQLAQEKKRKLERASTTMDVEQSVADIPSSLPEADTSTATAQEQQEMKKTRAVNITFASFDSDEED